MDLSERSGLAARRHPWEQARGGFFGRRIDRLVDGPVQILDAGAGDTWFAHELVQRLPMGTHVTCWDVNYSSDDVLAYASDEVTITSELPVGTFDGVLLLDVLEHVEDDHRFLAELVPHMRPGGWLVFSVPAWPGLYSAHDRALGHFRRYSPASATDVLRAAGLDIVASGGLFASLLLPRALQRLTERADTEPATLGHWRGGALVTRVITSVLAADGALGGTLADIGVPWPGLTWWAVCRRPG